MCVTSHGKIKHLEALVENGFSRDCLKTLFFEIEGCYKIGKLSYVKINCIDTPGFGKGCNDELERLKSFLEGHAFWVMDGVISTAVKQGDMVAIKPLAKRIMVEVLEEDIVDLILGREAVALSQLKWLIPDKLATKLVYTIKDAKPAERKNCQIVKLELKGNLVPSFTVQHMDQVKDALGYAFKVSNANFTGGEQVVLCKLEGGKVAFKVVNDEEVLNLKMTLNQHLLRKTG